MILLAIISLICHGDLTMKIHEQNTSSILSGDGPKGRQEVQEEDYTRATKENARRKKKEKLIGRVFGNLRVVSYSGLSKRGRDYVWSCICSCEKEIKAITSNLTSGNSTSCGCRGNKTPLNLLPKSDGKVSYIPLTHGKFAIVDFDDHERVSAFSWIVGSNGYAESKPNGKCVLMHRFINKTPIGFDTDHINGIKLDNRKSNLRDCTRSQNNMNKKIGSRNTSGYKGVSFHKACGKWRATIVVNRKQKTIGTFHSPEEAYKAYCEASKELHGEFSRL